MSGANLAAVAAEAAKGASKPPEEKKPTGAAAPTPAPQPAETTQQPQAAAAQQPVQAAVADLDAARAEGRTAALAYVAEVNDLCALAGQPDRARAFVDAGTSVADVRRALLDSRASADAGRQIATQHAGGAAAAPQKGALAARMSKMVGKGA